METLNPKILLVEDDHELRSFFGMLLSQEGHAYHEATNGAEALDYLEKRDVPDELCAFVDVRMPVMDGLTFVTEAQTKGLLKNVKVFFFTYEPLAHEVELAGKKFPVLSKLTDIERMMAVARGQ